MHKQQTEGFLHSGFKKQNNNFLNSKTKTCWNFFQDRAFTNGAKILKH